MMKIVNYKNIKHATIKAHFDIEFPIGLIKNFRLIETKGKKFISYPNIQISKDGERTYQTLYIPPKGKEQDFQKKCLQLLGELDKEK